MAHAPDLVLAQVIPAALVPVLAPVLATPAVPALVRGLWMIPAALVPARAHLCPAKLPPDLGEYPPTLTCHCATPRFRRQFRPEAT